MEISFKTFFTLLLITYFWFSYCLPYLHFSISLSTHFLWSSRTFVLIISTVNYIINEHLYKYIECTTCLSQRHTRILTERWKSCTDIHFDERWDKSRWNILQADCRTQSLCSQLLWVLWVIFLLLSETYRWINRRVSRDTCRCGSVFIWKINDSSLIMHTNLFWELWEVFHSIHS